MGRMPTSIVFILLTLFLFAACGGASNEMGDAGADADMDGSTNTDAAIEPAGLLGQIQPSATVLMQGSEFRLRGSVSRMPETSVMEGNNFRLNGRLEE